MFKEKGFRLVNGTDGGEGNLGRSPSKENIKKLIEATAKEVHQYDLDGNFIRTYNSCAEAARYLKMKSNSKIAMCARGKRKMAGRYQWSYEKHTKIQKYTRKNFVAVYQYSLNGKFLKKWRSIALACKDMGYHKDAIDIAVKKNKGIYKNYLWKKVK